MQLYMQTTSLNHPQMTWKIVTSGFFRAREIIFNGLELPKDTNGICATFMGTLGAYRRHFMICKGTGL
jgi:hypothetical protein